MRARTDVGAAATRAAARMAAAGAAWAVAWWFRFDSGLLPVRGNVDVLPARYLLALPVALLAVLVACRAAGMPHGPPSTSPRPAARELLAAAVLSTLVLLTAALLARDVFQYSRGFLLLHGLFLVPLLALAETAARALLSLRRGRAETVLIVGGAERAAALAGALERRGGGPVRIAGRAGPEGGDGTGPARLGSAGDAARLAAEHRVDRVVVLEDAADRAALLGALADGTADVALAWRLPSPEGFPAPDLDALGPFAVASYWESPLRGSGAALKRILDVALGILIGALLLPVLAAVALLVRISSRGPVLHRQRRVGLDGRTFEMLKFRTMVADAERESGPVFATPDDPRRTPFGSVLRRFSFDELPQLWNVIRGDMSLVGPRPERPEFVETFRRSHPGYMLRHSLRAGITGWAQVNGLRGRSSIEERLSYDLEYARRWSILFDLEILARTVVQVVAGRNAY